MERYPEERELQERSHLYLRVCERETARRPATPQTPQERVYAATVALNAGDTSAALDHLTRALSDSPESDHAHYIMSVALASKGDSPKAIDHLRRAITLNPENRALARQDPDLEPLRSADEFRDLTDAPAGRRPRPGPETTVNPLHLVVLAAGKGTRMKSGLPKVLHAAGGLPLIEHVLRTADTLSPTSIVIVVGHQAEAVRGALAGRPNLQFALQEPQLGTGHALLQAGQALAGATGTVVLLSGDVPLLTPATLQALVNRHVETGAAATVLTAMVADPAGYGRIERRDGGISAIVEHKDASPEQRQIREINSGIYAFDLQPLFGSLKQIGSANAQGEYYLPDLVRIYRDARPHGGDRHARRSAGDFRRQQPQGTGADWAAT